MVRVRSGLSQSRGLRQLWVSGAMAHQRQKFRLYQLRIVDDRTRSFVDRIRSLKFSPMGLKSN